MRIDIFSHLLYISGMAKKPEPDTLISVRCASPEEKKTLEKAGVLEQRKLGPYVLWAAKQYTREHHPELFAE